MSSRVPDLEQIDPTVLMVDDEKEVADAYALRLKNVATVDVVYEGEAALDTVDGAYTPDVVLLDRHMPGQSGDAVLESLRERAFKTRVIMITAVDPSLEVVDLPFDDYLCKPVERCDLRTAIGQQCQILAYELLGEYFQLISKQAVLSAERSPESDQGASPVDSIAAEAEQLRSRIQRLLPNAETLFSEFANIDRVGY